MASVSMGPAQLDITGVRAGDKNLLTVELTTDGDPWDLTGAQVTAQGRKVATDPDAAIEAVVTPVDEAAGKFTLAWDGEMVRVLLAGAESWDGVWDLQVVEAGATLADTVAEGALSCVTDVTR